MLELSLTRIRHSKDMPVLPGVVVHEEGVPLVQAMFDGKETAAVSGQDGAKIFLGFSYSETMRPVTKANITTVTPTANNLTFTLPGGFEEGKNYKTYTSPAQCEEQLRQLLADPAAILAMAQHNAAYYQAWLRPEQQVRQALRQLETGEM